MSHIFISYSKKNRDYARPLADHLITLGFDVWIDDEIQPSEDWWRNIRQAIKDCAAFVLVMTPEAETSHWVGLELLHALDSKKPMFPLLRAGDSNLLNSDSWSRIANLQYTDVRSGTMPPDKFIQNLVRRGVPRKAVIGTDITPPLPVATKYISSVPALPPPFEWCPIPEGKVTLVNTWDDSKMVYLKKDQPQEYETPAFSVAKYLITNAQFGKFVEAGGYVESAWWTDDGWREKLRRKWFEPRYWEDKKWNQPDYPVVGLSWYESAAFCLWLGDAIGAKIMLPTEQQWQRAAQGHDDRVYPWGYKWDSQRCNNSVEPSHSSPTTSVTQYEGQDKGNSPFGAVDMSGNVWEWCSTQYYSGQTDLEGTGVRVLRGGSWNFGDAGIFRADYRYWRNPNLRNYYIGLRPTRPS